MQVKSNGTYIEITFVKELYSLSVKIEKIIPMFLKPDLTFKKYLIVNFVDGEFW